MTKRAALKVCALMALLMALTAVDAAARPITLAWDASPDATVAGYRVYWSTQPGTFNDTDFFDAGDRLTWAGDLPGDQYYFAVRAYNAEGDLGALSLEVGDTSAFWLSNPGDQSSEAGQSVDLALLAHGAAVSYGADGLPAALDIDGVSGHVVGTVTEPAGIQVVTARAADASGRVSSVQFYWTVRMNHAPGVTNPGDQTTLGGDAVMLPINADDPDGDVLRYSATNLPAGLTLDAATGLITGRVSSTATGPFNVVVAVSDGRLVTEVAFAWQIWAGTGLILDRAISEDSVGSTVTATMSTAIAGETLVAFIRAAQPTATGAQTAVVSGGGLDWSLVARANAQTGNAEIWSARAPVRLSNETITAEVSLGGAFLSLTVAGFAGADGVGAAAAASAPTGAPAVSLTTTRGGSFVFGAGNDWDGSVPRTVPAGQELVHELLTGAGDTFWVQRLTGAVAAAGTRVTLNDVAPTDHQWNFAAVEIRARSQSVPTVVLTPPVAASGSPLAAAIAGAPGQPADWAGLFRETAGSTEFLARQYLNGSGVPPAAGMTSAQLTFAAPATPGRYNVRLFAAADPTTPIAVSNLILVPSTLSIGDVSLRETNAGSASMTFTVRLSAASPVPVSVHYATADGTARAGSDYAAQDGTLVFAPGTTQRTIAVTIFGDKTDEADESFAVVLSNATDALIADATGTGTIQDNDDTPKVQNQMFGFGALTDGRLRERFAFRVAERTGADYARLEFWSSEPNKGKGLDDDDRPGCDDNDYRHDHRAAKNRFEATTVTSLTFGPRDRGNQSVTFSGAGTWNGKAGYTFEARAADLGEPGRGRDTLVLIVKDQRGTVVLNTGGTIVQGNIQSTPASKH